MVDIFSTLLLLGLAIAGLGSGLLAGLLGIGAGSLMVPILVFFYSARQVPIEQIGLLAVATSLAAIIFLSAASLRAHHSRQTGNLRQIAWMAPTGMLAAWFGAQLSAYVGGETVLIAFAIFEAMVGMRYIRSIPPKQPPRPNARPTRLMTTGALSGGVASFFGVGGGIVAVPLQISWLGLPVHQSIANSSGIIVLNALTGTIGYAMAQTPTEIASIGWVDPVAAGILALGGIIGAPLGVRIAHQLEPTRLKRVFGGFLLIIAVVLAAKTITL